jgi:hypothetical protein
MDEVSQGLHSRTAFSELLNLSDAFFSHCFSVTFQVRRAQRSFFCPQGHSKVLGKSKLAIEGNCCHRLGFRRSICFTFWR